MKSFLEVHWNTPNKDNPRLKQIPLRLLLTPIVFFWWFVQLLIFSVMGCTLIVISFSSALVSIFKLPEDRFGEWEFFIESLCLPFICPLLWWYRYFRFGEYNILIDV